MDSNYWKNQFLKDKKRCLDILDKMSKYVPKGNTLPGHLSLYKKDDLSIYYAPFDEVEDESYSPTIKVYIVGLSPGIQQAQNEILSYIKSACDSEALKKHTREDVDFSGAMRANLIKMLDEINLPKMLKISSTADLFGSKANLLAVNSVLQFPVLYKGENYNGHTPKISQHPILKDLVDTLFLEDLKEVNNNALIIPLGKPAGDQIERICENNPQLKDRCLFGFPHPSGGNGHRTRIFSENKQMLERNIKRILK